MDADKTPATEASATDDPALFDKPNPWLHHTREHVLWQDGYDFGVAEARAEALDRCAHERDAPGWCYVDDAFWPIANKTCNRRRAILTETGGETNG